jgi:hypothetical protein
LSWIEDRLVSTLTQWAIIMHDLCFFLRTKMLAVWRTLAIKEACRN